MCICQVSYVIFFCVPYAARDSAMRWAIQLSISDSINATEWGPILTCFGNSPSEISL
ncbi:hypothetical protein XCR1_3060003 [Xenorhabdus cabanillasii JM26]|uniref:Uncharacterized protein n=1 Tax=Xenorhabdus cabanillasii JM26 TaxID=1427517 RepID=W1J6J4_9GAMM|nr:hypothetical protein XCR1_3060003 [Xenorhabdus cabanillasii JM26]